MSTFRPHPGAYSIYNTLANYILDSSSASRRQKNSAAKVQALKATINSVVARHPMPIFHKSQHYDKAENSGASPLYLWQYDTTVHEYFGQKYKVKIIAMPRDGNLPYTNYSYGLRYSYAYPRTDYFDKQSTNIQKFQDAFEATYTATVDPASPGIEEDGINTFNAFTILSLTVEQEPIDRIDTDLHDYAGAGLANAGDVITQNHMQEAVRVLDELRRYRLGIAFGWCATGFTGTPAVPGDHTGLHVDSATYVNLFDQSVTTRTATSPGSSMDARYAGRGPLDEVHGQRVKVYCRAYASSTGGASTLQFIGPAHHANNNTEITVPSGFSGWVGDSTNFVYLNPNADPDDATTSCNKIDFHGKTAGSDLYVYALRGIRAFP